VLLSHYISTALLIGADTVCICAVTWKTSLTLATVRLRGVLFSLQEWACQMTVAYQILTYDLVSLPVNISSTLSLCLSVHRAAQSAPAVLRKQCRGILGLADEVHILCCTAADYLPLSSAKLSHSFGALSLGLCAGCAENHTQCSFGVAAS